MPAKQLTHCWTAYFKSYKWRLALSESKDFKSKYSFYCAYSKKIGIVTAIFVKQHIITFTTLSQHPFPLLTLRFSFMLLSHQNFTIAVVFWLAHIKAPTNIYKEFRKQLYERWLLLDWRITLLQGLNLFTVTCVDFKIILMLKCLYGVSPTYHNKQF